MKKVLIHKIYWLWFGNNDDNDFVEMYCADPEGNLHTDEETSEFINKFKKTVRIGAFEGLSNKKLRSLELISYDFLK